MSLFIPSVNLMWYKGFVTPHIASQKRRLNALAAGIALEQNFSEPTNNCNSRKATFSLHDNLISVSLRTDVLSFGIVITIFLYQLWYLKTLFLYKDPLFCQLQEEYRNNYMYFEKNSLISRMYQHQHQQRWNHLNSCLSYLNLI